MRWKFFAPLRGLLKIFRPPRGMSPPQARNNESSLITMDVNKDVYILNWVEGSIWKRLMLFWILFHIRGSWYDKIEFVTHMSFYNKLVHNFFSKSTECFCSKCIRNCQEIFLSKFTFLRPKVMRIAPRKKKSSRYRVLEKYHFHMKLSTRPGAEVSYKNVYIETSPLVQRDI